MADADEPAEIPGLLRPVGVTAVVLGLCVLHFVVLFAVGMVEADDRLGFAADSLWRIENGARLVQRTGGLDLPAVWLDGEWWRILTAPFVHGSWLHLAFNMVALAAVGPWVESVLEKYYTLVLNLFACLASCIASMAWCEAALVVGASGGVLGLAGALWILQLWGPREIREQLAEISVLSLGLSIAAIVALGAFVDMIAQAGHLGGLAVGLVGGLLVRRPRLRLLIPALLVAAVVPLAAAPESRANYHAFLGYRWLDDGEHASARESLDRALEMRPDDPVLANAVAYALALEGVGLDRATELAHVALAAEPENPDFLDTFGWILCRQGAAEEGREKIRRALVALEGSTEPEGWREWLGEFFQGPGDSGEEISGHFSECAEAAVDPGPT